MASINEDKKQDSIASKLENADEKVGTIVVENVNGDAAPREVQAADGDDALRLVGTHAHQFDEAYYKRLRLKIVRIHSPTHPGRLRLIPSRTFTSCRSSASYTSPSSPTRTF